MPTTTNSDTICRQQYFQIQRELTARLDALRDRAMRHVEDVAFADDGRPAPSRADVEFMSQLLASVPTVTP